MPSEPVPCCRLACGIASLNALTQEQCLCRQRRAYAPTPHGKTAERTSLAMENPCCMTRSRREVRLHRAACRDLRMRPSCTAYWTGRSLTSTTGSACGRTTPAPPTRIGHTAYGYAYGLRVEVGVCCRERPYVWVYAASTLLSLLRAHPLGECNSRWAYPKLRCNAPCSPWHCCSSHCVWQQFLAPKKSESVTFATRSRMPRSVEKQV